jgi:hypothetical protein
LKVTAAERCFIFDGQVIAAKSHSIFAGQPKPLKIILIFSSQISAITAENNLLLTGRPYFQRVPKNNVFTIVVGNRMSSRGHVLGFGNLGPMKTLV